VKPEAGDDCDPDVDVTGGAHPVTDCAPYFYWVNWTTQEWCGNDIDHSYKVFVVDTTPPVLVNVPDDTSFWCNETSAIDVTIDLVHGTDNCESYLTPDVTVERIPTECPYEYKIVRSWYVHDCSDNSAEDEQTISVRYIDDFDMVSENDETETVECPIIPTQTVPTAGSTCAGSTTVDKSFYKYDYSCDLDQYVFQYYSTDQCADETIFNTVNVVDTTPPYVSDVQDRELACDEFGGVYGSLTTYTTELHDSVMKNDTCDSDPALVWTDDYDEICEGNFTFIREYLVTDCAGNDATESHTLTVTNNLKPFFSDSKPDCSFECDYVTPALRTADHDCGVTLTVTYTEESLDITSLDADDADDCGVDLAYVFEAYIRTWYAEDECGNWREFCDTAYVVDTRDPWFEGEPANMSSPCDDIIYPDPPTGADECDPDPTVTLVSHKDSSCAHEYTITYTWTVTDHVARTATYTSTLVVYDDEPPYFPNPPADDLDNECDGPTFDDISAEDLCDLTPDVSKWSNRTEEDCDGAAYTVVRSYLAKDICGNEALHEQTVTVVDTTPPDLYFVPDDTTIECDELMPADTVVANDTCTEITLTVSDTLETRPECPQHYVITRTWEARDTCGNLATDSQRVVVDDTTPPVLSGYPDSEFLLLDCNDTVPYEEVTECDICDDLVTGSADFTQEKSGPFWNLTLVRYWYAEDACGNSADFTQTIQVLDQTPPEIWCPDDVTYECDDITYESPHYNDTCGTPSLDESREKQSGSCPDAYTITRDFYVSDARGNSATCQQVITVRDTEAPYSSSISSIPSTQTEYCNHEPEVDVTWNDDCGEVADSMSETIGNQGKDQEMYSVFRQWYAEDECGNWVDYEATVIVKDITPPSGTPYSGNVSFECDSVPIGSVDDINFTDNCIDDPSVDWTETITEISCPNHYRIVRDYTATDSVGNSATLSYTLYIDDTTPPVIHDVDTSDQTYEYGTFGDDYTDLPTQTGFATDNCELLTYNNSVDKVSTSCPEVYSVIQTFFAVDECGNEAELQQTTYVVDTTPPTFTDYPEDITVECDAIPAACDVEVLHEDYTAHLNVDTSVDGKVVYTWNAQDCSGNTETWSYTVVIVDTTDPVFSRSPADEDVPCDCDTFPTMATITAIDNCDLSMTVETSEERIDSTSEDEYTLIRTWYVKDDANNDATHQQTVTVYDDTPPVIDFVQPTVFDSCDSISAHPVLNRYDNCDPEPSMGLSVIKQPGSCPEAYELHRSWDSFDRSGNQHSRDQIVHVRDEVAPDGVELDEDTCIFPPNGEFVKIQKATTSLFDFSDNCDPDFTVEILSCNSSEPQSSTEGLFTPECWWSGLHTDNLWIKADRDGSTASDGRTYTITIRVTDGCYNTQTFHKTFFVPYDGGVYVENGKCCLEPEYENST